MTKFTQENAAKEIIFFASWCKSCVDSIKKSNPNTSVLVGVMDSKENIDSAYVALKAKTPCYFGDEKATEYFKVKYLPYAISPKKD